MKQKIQPIQAIFKNDKTGLIFQDILKYSIEGENKEDDGKSFRLWYLIKQLLKTNQEFVNHFKDPSTRTMTTSNKIKDRTDRVGRRIDDLVKLGLIIQIGTAKELKGNARVPIFRFTPVGHAIAWIIESKGDERGFAIEKLYELFQDNFKDDASFNDKFNSIYYRKIKELGLFGVFIDRSKNICMLSLLET